MRRDDDDRDPQERDPRSPGPDGQDRTGGVTPRQVLIAVLAVLLIAFAIANFDQVEVNFLLFQTRARVITVVLVAGILGFGIGYMVGRPTREERRRLRRGGDE